VAPATGRAELARLYAGCRVVVVPLRENRHASGATACVEAMAAGRALVVTDAGGVRDYVAGTRARLVAPHDAAALAEAVRRALGPGEATSAADVRARGLRQEDYVARYVLLTRALVAQAEIPAAVSSFEPVAEEAGLAP
ncbi:glycosyltransferase family 4 protein, partial [Cellulosimicrobium funkei]